MRRVKATISLSLVALALGGLVAAAASAATAGWMVKGASLTGSTALATSTVSDTFALSVGSTELFECSGPINFSLPEIVAPNLVVIKGGEITECLPRFDTVCGLEGNKIHLGSLLGEVTLEGALALDTVLKPEKGSAIFSWKVVGSECPGAGESVAVGGEAVLLAPTGQEERTLQELVWASSELKPNYGVSGSALVKLASGEPWSFL